MPDKKTRVIPCGVAIIRKERQFLISQRHADDTFGSYWEFPGGKRNEGETFEQCVVRETMEELGVEVRAGKKFMEIRKTYDDKTIWLNFYLCDYVSGDPRPLDCQKVVWAELAELKNFLFPPANERVINRLLKHFS